MNDRIQRMRNFFVTDKKHHAFRQAPTSPYILANSFSQNNVSDIDRSTQRLKYVLDHEIPVIFEDEKIALTRTVVTIPELWTESELSDLKKQYWLHESGDVTNINVLYSRLINTGFIAKRQEIYRYLNFFDSSNDASAVHYLQCLLSILDSVESLAERYRLAAIDAGNQVVADSLSNIPQNPPRNFIEALQFFRLIHFCMWAGGNYHNTVGRLDQYLYSYLMSDLASGILTYDEALEILEEFFISFNRDSDLYPSLQQGANGQSMMLGGVDEFGNDCYNEFSDLAMQASLEVRVIEPQVNMRVDKNTPKERFVKGTHMTKQGLGFPQYSNDDIVIPGLMKLGYSLSDARNYTVAACWEFIIPGVGMDIPNIAAFSFLDAILTTLRNDLLKSDTFEIFMDSMKRNIFKQASELVDQVSNVYMFPAPFVSLMMEGTIEHARDISLGCKYNNYGIHGTGLANAADSLAAIKKYVFEEGSISKDDLIMAINQNFNGFDELRAKLRYDAPKMGKDDDYVDLLGVNLSDLFAESLCGRKNERGGVFRPGTGTAMYYIWHSQNADATPDGRAKGEAIPANYSPSLFSRCEGPVSIIKSFTKADLTKVINGGPLTLELHDSVFHSDDSIEKVADLVRSFIIRGGHQLQLNAVNRDTLLAAQKKPDEYKNLIVRVWGWSGYFVEIGKEYQDHVISRMELST